MKTFRLLLPRIRVTFYILAVSITSIILLVRGREKFSGVKVNTITVQKLEVAELQGKSKAVNAFQKIRRIPELNRFKKDQVYQPAERCKVIYSCASSLNLPVPTCGGKMEERLALIKIYKGKLLPRYEGAE